jgi:hypothetical protein
MARNGLTYIVGFSVKFFFQPIYTVILKQQWTIEEIYIFSNSSHLEWRAGLSDTILKGNHPGTIPARFGLISRLPTKMATKLKIEKRGDEILIVHCCFSVSQNELKF